MKWWTPRTAPIQPDPGLQARAAPAEWTQQDHAASEDTRVLVCVCVGGWVGVGECVLYSRVEGYQDGSLEREGLGFKV